MFPEELMYKIFHLLVVFFIGTFSSVWAQNKFSLEGKIIDSETKVPITSAIIKIGENITYSDDEGVFRIKFNSTQQKIEIHHISYVLKILEIPVNLENVEIYLQPKTNTIKEVRVSSGRNKSALSKSLGGIQTLTKKDIEKTPGFLGQKDPIKAIQSLPGVGKGGDGNSGLYIRGGSSGENLTLLNDAIIYNPSHLIGLFSVFNPSVVDEVNLYKTGVPSMHSGRISSLIEISSSALVKDSAQLELDVSQFSVNANTTIPVSKNWSVGLHARKTFLNQTVWPILNNLSSSSFFEKMNYDFYDLNLISNSKIGDNNTLQLSFYTGGDNFGFRLNRFNIKNSMDWKNTALSANWRSTLSSNTTLNTIISYSGYNFNFSMQQDDYTAGINSKINDYNFKSYLSFYKGKHILKTGIQYINHHFTPNTPFAKSLDTELDYGEPNIYYADESSVFVNDEVSMSEKIKLYAGLRFNYFRHKGPYVQSLEDNSDILYKKNATVGDYLFVEPSLSINYSLNESSTIKAVIAHNVQPVHLISITAVNFPADFWMPSVNNLKPAKSFQGSLGYFKDLDNKDYSFYVDVYYKEMKNLVEFSGGIINLIDNLKIEDNLLIGSGRAYGTEFFLKKNTGKLNGWLGYTISKSQRVFDKINDGKKFPFKYDRTHDLSLIINYTFNKRLNISSSFVYASGNAYTMPVSRYTLGGNVVNEYGDYNASRMPALHRLDLSSNYKLKKRKKFESELSFSIYNIYNRKNPIYKFFLAEGDLSKYKVAVTSKSIALLPILPAINYKVKFK